MNYTLTIPMDATEAHAAMWALEDRAVHLGHSIEALARLGQEGKYERAALDVANLLAARIRAEILLAEESIIAEQRKEMAA